MRTTVCLLLGVVAAGWAVGSPDGPPERLPDVAAARPYGIGIPHGDVSPAASCAAAACHGGGHPGRRGSELTTWATDLSARRTTPQDPHAKAYRVLFNEDSVRMSRLLAPDGSKPVPAHKNDLCLKCHAVGGGGDEQAAEGVGCAACHGSAGNWLTTHYLPGWKGMSNRDKASYGMTPTKNLVARISNCATCHVGAADRDVNHDLIAAGHPRLAFEYTRFHYQPTYGKHWTETLGTADFESRAWAIGQVASLRAAVEVLQSRAAQEKAAWPEFAGYSCYACHQSVGTGEPRGPGVGGTGKLPGWPGWEVWYTATVGPAAVAAKSLFPGVPDLPLGHLDELRAVMDRRAAPDGAARPAPTREQVRVLAGRVLDDLGAWLAAAQAAEDGPLPPAAGHTAAIARAVAGHALAAAADHPTQDWDFLAAHYLGTAAFHHAGGATDAGRAKVLRELGDDLQFPRLVAGERFDSPGVFGKSRLSQVRAGFRSLSGGRDTPGGSR